MQATHTPKSHLTFTTTPLGGIIPSLTAYRPTRKIRPHCRSAKTNFAQDLFLHQVLVIKLGQMGLQAFWTSYLCDSVFTSGLVLGTSSS